MPNQYLLYQPTGQGPVVIEAGGMDGHQIDPRLYHQNPDTSFGPIIEPDAHNSSVTRWTITDLEQNYILFCVGAPAEGAPPSLRYAVTARQNGELVPTKDSQEVTSYAKEGAFYKFPNLFIGFEG
jgi:hypothetical protein